MKKYTRLDLHKLTLENDEGYNLIDYILELQDNSIPKKKIENKIKELEKKKRDLSPFGMGKIEGLYELLEDK